MTQLNSTILLSTLLLCTACSGTQLNRGAALQIHIVSTLPDGRIGQFTHRTGRIELLRMAPPRVTAEIIGVWTHELVHAMDQLEPQAAQALRDVLRSYQGGAVKFNLHQHNYWKETE